MPLVSTNDTTTNTEKAVEININEQQDWNVTLPKLLNAVQLALVNDAMGIKQVDDKQSRKLMDVYKVLSDRAIIVCEKVSTSTTTSSSDQSTNEDV
jgi:hypothetical protein